VGGGVAAGDGGEVEAAGQGKHGGVFGEDVGDDGVDFFGAGDLDEAGDEFATEARTLMAIGDKDAEFGFLAS
jgi:hypothetical protein